jgi:hypothetical protein
MFSAICQTPICYSPTICITLILSGLLIVFLTKSKNDAYPSRPKLAITFCFKSLIFSVILIKAGLTCFYSF